MIAPANARQQSEWIEGAVESKNANGIRVDGQWLSRSKFKPVELPEIGALVRLQVDAKGFIQSVEVLAPAEPTTAAAFTADRDERIARLTVLKAAAHFAATRTDIKSSDVLRICDSWLAWVEQLS